MENSEWRQTHQNILLEVFYFRNKKGNGNQSCFYQGYAGSWNKLQDIWQRTTSHSRSSDKVKIIPIGHHQKVQSLDRPQKSQVFQETTQIQ